MVENPGRRGSSDFCQNPWGPMLFGRNLKSFFAFLLRYFLKICRGVLCTVVPPYHSRPLCASMYQNVLLSISEDYVFQAFNQKLVFIVFASSSIVGRFSLFKLFHLPFLHLTYISDQKEQIDLHI